MKFSEIFEAKFNNMSKFRMNFQGNLTSNSLGRIRPFQDLRLNEYIFLATEVHSLLFIKNIKCDLLTTFVNVAPLSANNFCVLCIGVYFPKIANSIEIYFYPNREFLNSKILTIPFKTTS